MNGFVIAFAIVGIIVAVIAVVLFGAWAVSFYATVAVKTFKQRLSEYVDVQKEHNTKKNEARRERLAKSREQKEMHKNEMLEAKMASRQRVFEMKKQAEEEKLRKSEKKVAQKLNVEIPKEEVKLVEKKAEPKKEKADSVETEVKKEEK